MVDGLIKLIRLPCWVFVYRFREYALVINLIDARNVIKNSENDVVAVINIISLNILIDGGAAMFTVIHINHHIVIVGRSLIIPFIRYILRVCRIS